MLCVPGVTPGKVVEEALSGRKISVVHDTNTLMATILQLTTSHPRTDPRIFVKESQTLASRLSHKVVLMVADGLGNANVEGNAVRVHDLGRLKWGRFARMLLGPWRPFFSICRIKPDIVHFHDPEMIPLGLLLRVLGYKVIYDVHEDFPSLALSRDWVPWIVRKPLVWGMTSMEWLGGKIFTAIVPATPKIAEKFSVRKSVTVQNYPIGSEMCDSTQIPYTKRLLSFTYVGCLGLNRGAVEMVRAFEFLKDIPSVCFDLAGEISPNDLNTLETLSGWSSVNYHGLVSRKQVSKILGGARAGLVLFHPASNHVNAQPTKLFEYMATGLPVIASSFPLWREIIGGAECGLLVDPLDPNAIADAMRWILDHPAEAEAMGERGRQAVQNIYSWDTEASKLVELYERLLSSG